MRAPDESLCTVSLSIWRCGGGGARSGEEGQSGSMWRQGPGHPVFSGVRSSAQGASPKWLHWATAGERGAQGGGGGSCAPGMVPDRGIRGFLPQGHALLGTGHECAWEAAPETQVSQWDCPLARWGEGSGFQTTVPSQPSGPGNQNPYHEEGCGLPGLRQGLAPLP